jgi:hypothetical protein
VAVVLVVALGGHALFHSGGGSAGKQAADGRPRAATPASGARVDAADGDGEHVEDVRVSRCDNNPGHTFEGDVVVTNHAAVTSSYVIVVVFVDTATNQQADSGFVTVDGLGPGQVAAPRRATGLKSTPSGGYSCRVSKTMRYRTP